MAGTVEITKDAPHGWRIVVNEDNEINAPFGVTHFKTVSDAYGWCINHYPGAEVVFSDGSYEEFGKEGVRITLR